MSTLAENIKLFNPFKNRLVALQALYQILFPFLLIFTRNEVAKSLESNQYPAMVFYCYLSAYMLGSLVAVIQVDLLTKPFSACLPEQNKIQVNILFLAGITASMLYCAVFFLLPHPDGFKGMLFFISIVTIGFSLFIIGAFLTFYVQDKREAGQAVLIFNIFGGLGVYLLMMFDVITIPLDHFLYYASVPLLILAISMAAAMRKKMLHPDFKRTLALKDFSLPVYSNMTSTIQQADRFMLKRLSDRVKNETASDGFFSRLIKKYPYFSLIKSIAAEIYSIMDRYYTLNERYFKTALFIKIIVLSLLLLITGYRLSFTDMNDSAVKIAHNFSMVGNVIQICIFIAMSGFATSMVHPVNHNHLFPEGRSIHFCSSMIIWLLKQAIIAAWVFLFIVSAHIFKNIMPGITISGLDLQYSVPVFSIILWPLVIAPVFDLFMYYLKKPCSLLIMIIFLALLIVISLYSIATINPAHKYVSLVLVILLANGFFIERLARHWFKKDIGFLN